MRKIIQIIVFLFTLVTVLIIVDFIKNDNSKFEETKINTHLKNIIVDWGNPDKEFIYEDLNNSIVYKYKKDYLGWETYIFIFNPGDSLLISKHIDD